MICYDMLRILRITNETDYASLMKAIHSGQIDPLDGFRRDWYRNHHWSAGTVELLYRTPGMFCHVLSLPDISGQSSVQWQ